MSVLNNAKEAVLLKAFGESGNSESSPINQSLRELSRSIIHEIRHLPGNQMCCDCNAAGKNQILNLCPRKMDASEMQKVNQVHH